MNSLLTSPDFTKDFIISPAQNVYIVGLRVGQEQAEQFGGHDFVAFCFEVLSTENCNIMYAYEVHTDGEPGDYRVDGSEFTDAQFSVLNDLSPQISANLNAWIEEVEDDLPAYYEVIRPRQSLEDVLRELLGGDVQIGSIEDLIVGKIKIPE